jgi:hypothetical protein
LPAVEGQQLGQAIADSMGRVHHALLGCRQVQPAATPHPPPEVVVPEH